MQSYKDEVANIKCLILVYLFKFLERLKFLTLLLLSNALNTKKLNTCQTERLYYYHSLDHSLRSL